MLLIALVCFKPVELFQKLKLMMKNINYLHSCFSVYFFKPRVIPKSKRLKYKTNCGHLAFFAVKCYCSTEPCRPQLEQEEAHLSPHHVQRWVPRVAVYEQRKLIKCTSENQLSKIKKKRFIISMCEFLNTCNTLLIGFICPVVKICPAFA